MAGAETLSGAAGTCVAAPAGASPAASARVVAGARAALGPSLVHRPPRAMRGPRGPARVVRAGDGPADAPWIAEFRALLVRWVERGGRAWNDTAHRDLVGAHEPWFDRLGEDIVRHTVRQSVDDFVTAQHSRATWARARMGAEAT